MSDLLSMLFGSVIVGFPSGLALSKAIEEQARSNINRMKPELRGHDSEDLKNYVYKPEVQHWFRAWVNDHIGYWPSIWEVAIAASEILHERGVT